MVVYSKWFEWNQEKHAPLQWFQAIFAIDKSEQVIDVLRHSRRIVQSYFFGNLSNKRDWSLSLLIDLTSKEHADLPGKTTLFKNSHCKNRKW